MVTATLTSKGQVTIPKTVRNSLHLRTGDRIAFIVNGHAEAVLKPVTKSVDEVFGLLHSPTQTCRSIDDMKAAVAARMRSCFLNDGPKYKADLSDILIAHSLQTSGCERGITFDKSAAKLPFFSLLE
jgi:AbrB family looped-hinge helix DNA binding protein